MERLNETSSRLWPRLASVSPTTIDALLSDPLALSRVGDGSGVTNAFCPHLRMTSVSDELGKLLLVLISALPLICKIKVDVDLFNCFFDFSNCCFCATAPN